MTSFVYNAQQDEELHMQKALKVRLREIHNLDLQAGMGLIAGELGMYKADTSFNMLKQ